MSTDNIFFSPLVDTAEHHAALRESVARLVGGFGRRYYQEVVAAGEPPTQLWSALADAGFLGAHISEAYGGSGGGLADLNVIIEETAAQGCPLLFLVIQSICAPILERYATQAIKDEWLPALAAGKKKMAFAITEPNAGSNTHKVTTTAKSTDSGFTLSGTKYWTSGVDEAEAMLVVARNGDEPHSERSSLSLFIVPTDAPGITLNKIPAALMTPENQFMVFFDDVQLPREALVGEPGAGLKQVFVGLNPERVAAAAINNGIARYALSKGSQYARERSVWKTTIGAHQGVSHPLAEAYINVQAARLLTARAAQLFDAGEEAAEAANMAKFCAAESSLKALDQAMQVHGGNGLSYEYGLADLWFIARLHKTAPVSREMILNYVAQHSLGLEKSY
jgi:alkylation response protein AidB-like acyl-CoA dehydrogenase